MRASTHRIGSGSRRQFGRLARASLIVAMFGAGVIRAGDGTRTTLKTEHFDRDPGWEGVNNHVEPRRAPTVTQDFGHGPTAFAAKEKGEVGGRVTRASNPAYYAREIAPRTLNDPLTASGTFALTASSPGAGAFFGWFGSDQPTGGGRPINSLGFNIDTEGKGGRLAVRLIGGTNRSCGTFITPYVPGKYRPTPIKNDGTRYHWTLAYDPAANEGRGRFQARVWSDGPAKEEFEGKTFTVDLPEGFKERGATFNRFGLLNMTKPGGHLTIHFADLRHDGTVEDLSKDPGWIGQGNRATYQDRMQVGAHDFGFHAGSSFAGGTPGEVGGDLWRSGAFGYYADRVGPLSLDDRLEARGKVVLKVGAPDSDMFLGWFRTAAEGRPPAAAGDFVGVHVGGQTRVGHYFHPSYATARGARRQAEAGPVLTPGKVYDWSLVYDPAANGGLGEIRVTLGQESVTLALKPGDRARGASLDHFGLFTSDIGGQLVRIFLDDLEYTAARRAP